MEGKVNMKCRKCRAEIPENSKYCMLCGVKQDVKQKPKSRGNGQGSVFQLPNKSWKAVITLGYERDGKGKVHRVTRSKSGFKTKKEALDFLPKISTEPKVKQLTFKEVYDAWLPTHRAGKSTLDCYKAAIKYFRDVWFFKMSDITVDDLQECMDACTKGKRTKENMKALCGLLYKYAIPRRLAALNMGQYLIVDAEGGEGKDALPDAALKSIEEHAADVVGADYVLCQCYLGFRPSEFLALDVGDYNSTERAFVGGAKTEAGKNRVVTVSPKIQPYIDKLVNGKDVGPVFCGADGSALDIKSYRSMFYEVLDSCGVENPISEQDGIKRRKYTPHSCRHTFATLMKRVAGSDKDKLELIGHSSTAMLRHYQDVSFADLRQITDKI